MDNEVKTGNYCKACGTAIDERAELCVHCGVRQNTFVSSKKRRGTAILLAFFLGGFGIHKFYLGKTIWGVLYLLFFWTFIPSLIALIESIIYLTMSDEAFAVQYTSKQIKTK